MNDTISRQAAIDAFEMNCYPIRYDHNSIEKGMTITGIKQVLDELPPVQPERKTGHWVETGDEPYDEWECDVCGFAIDGSGCIDPEEYRDVYKFCPNCGADMRGEAE